MANQPKKYKKFVASAATATLVASAIVPVASAATPSDIAGNDHEQNIKDLLELGYVSGKADGSFAPNEAVTRGQVVLMLGKWAEAQGIEVPADYLEKEYFTDYPSYLTDDNKKYYALVKAAGIFEGYADGSLKPGQNISRVQMAVVLNSAYEAVTGKSLVELAGDTSDVVVNDIDAVYADYQPAVLAMKKLGITAVSNYNPSGTVTRGQFASFLNATIKAEAPAGEAGAIKSLTATGVSELTVEFDGAVDPEAVEFKLTRGTTEYTVSDVDFNENNTAAVLTVDTKFVDATYTLTVTGISEEAATATVTTTREVVSSIEFLSDALVIVGENTSDDTLDVAVSYQVLNQYGEDISSQTIANSIDPKLSGISDKNVKAKEKNRIVWTIDGDEDEGETGTVTLKYDVNDIYVTATQEVTLSEESVPFTAELLTIYNEDNKALTTANLKDAKKKNVTDSFKLLLNLTDQYGLKIDPKLYSNNSQEMQDLADEFRVKVSNDDIFDLDEEKLGKVSIDGKEYFYIPLDLADRDDQEAGTNTVTFIADAAGEEITKGYEVAASEIIERVNLELPEEVVADGDSKVQMKATILDQNGEQITDLSAVLDAFSPVNDGVPGSIDVDVEGAVSGSTTFVEKDGEIYLEFKLASLNIAHDKTKEVDVDVKVEGGTDTEYTLTVNPKAYAATLVGLQKDVSRSIFINTIKELELEDFIIEDQYGRIMEEDDINLSVVDIVAESSNGTKINLTSDKIQTNGDSIYVEALNGSENVKFSLTGKDNNNKNVSSEFNISFRTVEEDDFESYKVVELANVYADNSSMDATSAYAKQLEVYGITASGDEVLLPSSLYTVSTGDYLAHGTTTDATANISESYIYVNSAGFAKVDTESGPNKDSKETLDATVKVTINQTGETIATKALIHEQSFTPEVAKLSINDNGTGKELTELTVDIFSSETFNLQYLLDALNDEGAEFRATDNYGVKYQQITNDPETITATSQGVRVNFVDTLNTDATVKFIVSNVNDLDDDYKITGNSTATPVVTGLEDGTSFDLTLTVDGATKTIKVRVK